MLCLLWQLGMRVHVRWSVQDGTIPPSCWCCTDCAVCKRALMLHACMSCMPLDGGSVMCCAAAPQSGVPC